MYAFINQNFQIMKRIAILTAMTFSLYSLFGQSPSARDGSFFDFPALRYSVCHMRQYLPTTNVPRNNTTKITPFPVRAYHAGAGKVKEKKERREAG